jgi:hypothetical protein
VLPGERLDVEAGEVDPPQPSDTVERRVRRDQRDGLRGDRGRGEDGAEGASRSLSLEWAPICGGLLLDEHHKRLG